MESTHSLKNLFIENHCEFLLHSAYSFLHSPSQPSVMMERAVAVGHKQMAITDMDGVYGIVQAYKSKQSLSLLYGMEVHLEKDHLLPLTQQNTIVLLAKSIKGYAGICQVSTEAHVGGKKHPYISLSRLFELGVSWPDLVCILPMRGLLRRGEVDQHFAQLKKLKKVFCGDLYQSVGVYNHPGEDCFRQHYVGAAEKESVELVLSQDIFFSSPEDKYLSDVMQAIRMNKSIEEVPRHLFVNDHRSILSLDYLFKLYQDLPYLEQCIINSKKIISQIQFKLSELRYAYPKEMLPEGRLPQEFLEELVWASACSYYKASLRKKLPTKVMELLNKELKLVEHLMFADYFLTVWDIVRWARSQGIVCQGRGSAANSVICFVLGITSVDPTQFEVLFERFLSVERGDPPDIDIDFEHERREEVIQYIYRRYGRSKAAMVANVIKFRRRGAYRFSGKALGIGDATIQSMSSFMDRREFRHKPPSESMKLFMARRNEKLQSDKLDNDIKNVEIEKQENPDIFYLWAHIAGKLNGLPRHLGIHSGGFILSQFSLNELVPQEPATMEGRTVIQWSKDDVETLGLFKIDVLALGMLTAVRKCIGYIQELEHAKGYSRDKPQLSSMHDIPHGDTQTYDMICRADVVGVFQIESRAQMSMLPRLRPRCLYDLVIEVAIIRPGPIQGGLIHPYLRRRNGQEPVQYAHPKLVNVLERTLGVPLFQEQVMRIAIEVGDFTAGEADKLRKSMGAWQIRGDLHQWMKKLVTGMRRHKINELFIKQLVGQMQGFAEYGFPESHAISFAHIAYVSCYLKSHYPHLFTLAMLNSQPLGFYSSHALLQDAKRQGVRVAPVCVQSSQWQTSLERTPQGEPVLRMGFDFIRGLNQGRMLAFVQLRKSKQGGRWSCWQECLAESDLHRDEMAFLAAADAFCNLGLSRREAFWLMEALPTLSIPGLEDPDLFQNFAPESKFSKVRQDFRATGTSLHEHPAEVIRQTLWSYPVAVESLTSSKEITSGTRGIKSGKKIRVFGMVLVRQAPPTAKGMVFFTLEDSHGFFNLVFRPDVFRKYASFLHEQPFLCVEGVLQVSAVGSTQAASCGASSILVKKVFVESYGEAGVISLEPNTHSGASMSTADASKIKLLNSLSDFRRARNYH